MGVGAVFISTLALTRLPKPNNPPQDQQELLAASLQPIVAFVVLGSILIRQVNQSPKVYHTDIMTFHRWVIHPFLLSVQELFSYCIHVRHLDLPIPPRYPRVAPSDPPRQWCSTIRHSTCRYRGKCILTSTACSS